jgi:short-subunit dehydrogenase
MREQESGHIINISSGVGVYSLPGLGLYSASKYALEGLSESLAASLSNWNIRVSIVEPGFVNNNWGKHCVVGSRVCNVEFYTKLNQGICNMLSTSRGQPNEEIAKLLLEIADMSKPNVRYQTSDSMRDWVSEKLLDPTGMKAYQDNLQFINRLIKE